MSSTMTPLIDVVACVSDLNPGEASLLNITVVQLTGAPRVRTPGPASPTETVMMGARAGEAYDQISQLPIF